jgi:hypothetical protein
MIRRIFTLLGLCALLSIGPALALADEVPVDGAEPIVAPSETDRWWGALGAVLCGGGIRLAIYNPAVGMNPYVLAGTISCCLIAALDVAI